MWNSGEGALVSVPEGQGQDVVVPLLLFGEDSPLLAPGHGRVSSAGVPACQRTAALKGSTGILSQVLGCFQW